MERVSIVGVPGAGKTTVGRQLAGALDVPFVELDQIFHQPGWRELPLEQFRARVSEAVGADRWVVDGNYSAVRDLAWDRADTVVWLDLPRWLVMRRVVARTLRRVVTREELWNGNREPFGNLYRVDPTKNIIRWAWGRYPVYRERYAAAMVDPAYDHLQFVRVRTPSDIEALLAGAAPCG